MHMHMHCMTCNHMCTTSETLEINDNNGFQELILIQGKKIKFKYTKVKQMFILVDC